MICRQCGAEVDTRRRCSDGAVQCYNCKKLYYPRNSSQQIVRQPAPPRARNRSKASMIPWKRKFAKLPLWLWCVIAVVLIIMLSSGGDETARNDVTVQQSAEASPADNTVQSQGISENQTASIDSAAVTAQSRTSEDLVQYPQTVFDAKGVSVTITGFEKNAMLGPEIKVVVENNSGMNLFLSLGELYCQGWQLAGYTASFDLANGSKAAETIYILASTLDECGLKAEDLKEVTFKNASLNNSDNYMQEYTFDMAATLQ